MSKIWDNDNSADRYSGGQENNNSGGQVNSAANQVGKNSIIALAFSFGAIFIGVLMMLAVVFNFFGCSSNSKSEPTSAAVSSTAATAEVAAEVETAANNLRIGSMKGATSVGLAHMMQKSEGVFSVVASADELAPKFLQGEIDIALLPANLAATLQARTKGELQVIDINTLGVLYAVAAVELNSVEDFRGKTVYMTGKGTVPEYTLRALLQAANIAEGEVDIQFKSEPAEVVALLSQAPDAIGILPQPFATAAQMKNKSLVGSLDLSAVWEEVTGGQKGSLITGVTVAKASFVKDNPEVIAEFLRRRAASVDAALSAPKDIAPTIVELGIIDNLNLAEAAIPKCNVVCITGAEMKTALMGYLETLLAQNAASIGGELPNDTFYYIGSK